MRFSSKSPQKLGLKINEYFGLNYNSSQIKFIKKIKYKSPNLNPIVMIWNKLKNNIRKKRFKKIVIKNDGYHSFWFCLKICFVIKTLYIFQNCISYQGLQNIANLYSMCSSVVHFAEILQRFYKRIPCSAETLQFSVKCTPSKNP
ncbi:hypothetical protein BpHYR1_007274 [Brachionus plicatilis]|uniref:Uncharacterized protein n=1 Tax=Brachionus plicatilis TaxID=10195 RepID=A0A3M7QSU1_BRAPC|nr:hypothetical protein BpHYR1_007274 [Brachionus plicatilis]